MEFRTQEKGEKAKIYDITCPELLKTTAPQ
jgi:hypothetical protein